MGRRRKIPIMNEEKENDCDDISESSSVLINNNNDNLYGPMYTIMSNVQKSETLHKRYIKEMKQLYARMDHDSFLYTFIKMIKVAMEADENNEYANTTLIFCAKFVSSYNEEDTHPMLLDTCKWLLSTISYNPHIRLRLCQFVNMILNALGKEAALDDTICDRILEYMMAQLRDVAPSVRVQAILAMQRLQVPDNPDDPVVRVYQFHLCSDPSPRVRQTVITCIGRNYNTIPYVLERLWDIDERVRRHTYLHMSSYPVRSYKLRQRLMLLEQGLNDRSEAVRKVVTKILLQQWLESYDRNVISLIAALKLDVNEQELDRFRKASKQMLKEVFKRQPIDELVNLLPKYQEGNETTEEEELQFPRCVPLSALNVEVAFYWQGLTEYLQTEMADELDLILPELSTFCQYVEKFCQSQNSSTDQFEFMNSQFILLSLLEIACNYDLGEEVGRENLHKLLTTLLKNYRLNQRVICIIVKCIESLLPDTNIRLHYFSEIIQEVCCLNAKQNPLVHDRTLITKLLSNSTDTDLNLKLTSLKVRILDLEEQESDCWQKKNYEQAIKYTDEKNAVIEEYTKLLQPYIDKYADAEMLGILSKDLKNEIVVKGLQIIFYMVNSEKVNTINPSASKLYNDFICRHIASNNISARDWALKCGTVFSMLYEPNAKEVFEELYAQFSKNHNIRLWETSINCMIDLLDRYGISKFAMPEKVKSKKTLGSGRQLYNTMEYLDMEEENTENHLSIGQGVDVVFLLSHFLDSCQDVCIVKSIVTGFCRLILRGHLKNSEILEKLLLRYFNPAIDSEINQILGVFLETLLAQRKHHLLEPCLLPTVNAIFSAPYDSPLRDIRPETIMRFIIDSTLPDVCNSSEVIHNRMVRSFLQEMVSNVSNKDLCKILSKELHSLRPNVRLESNLKEDAKEMINRLLESEIEKRTGNYLREFGDKLDGIFRMSAPRTTSMAGSDNEDEELGIAESDTASTTTTGTAAAMELPAVPALVHAVTPLEEESIIAAEQESTTFGSENRKEHHSLRKSMKPRNPEVIITDVEESRETESSAQPPKIRIEARIDSDTSPASVQNITVINNKTLTPEKSISPKSSTITIAKSTPRRQTRRQVKDVEKTPQTKSKPTSTPSTSKTAKSTTKVTPKSSLRDLATPVSTRSTRTRATTQKESSNKTLSTPDVIPASPSSPKRHGNPILYSLRKRVNTKSQSVTTVGDRKSGQGLNISTNDTTLAKSLSATNVAYSSTPKTHTPKRKKAENEVPAVVHKKRLQQPVVRLKDVKLSKNVEKKVRTPTTRTKTDNHSSTPRRTARSLERSAKTTKRTGTPSVDTLRKSTGNIREQEATNDSKRSRQTVAVTKIPRLTRASQAAPNTVKTVRIALKNMKSRLPVARKNK